MSDTKLSDAAITLLRLLWLAFLVFAILACSGEVDTGFRYLRL